MYVRKLDPDYNKQFPGIPAFADYDYRTRPENVSNTIDTCEQRHSSQTPDQRPRNTRRLDPT